MQNPHAKSNALKGERRKARMNSRKAGKGILMTAATALWCCGAVMAQQSGGMQQQQPQPGQQQQMPSQQGTAPGTASGMPVPNQPSQQAYGDQMFVHDTLEGNDAQVEMSRLAQEKSASPDVKQFSAKMVQIHTELNDQLKPAAKELGMSEPSGPSKKEKKEIERLQGVSGPTFDDEYIQAMAKQQQHDLKGFKDEAQSGQTANIQEAAKQDEPVLAQHYQVLEQLAQAHNVTLESKN
jgi:putative membrane protein